MSDILIKNMKMPTNCWDCAVARYANCDIGLKTKLAEDYMHKRYDGCPLFEVPTPHGRLIDADRLIRELKNIMSEDNLHFAELMYIVGQSTIIEREDGEF